jgi:hypothetical protein
VQLAAPVVAAKVPAPQLTQVSAPLPENSPTPHGVHAEEPMLNW